MSWSVCPRPRKRRSTGRPPTSIVVASSKVRSGGSMTTSARSAARSGSSRGDDRPPRLAGPLHERHAALVPPDRRGPEDVIAVGMVEVTVRVDDDRHRVRRQLAQVRDDLARLDVRRARVDDERLAVPEDDADVLVVERVAPHEHAIAELDPAILDAHPRMVSTAPDGRCAGRVRWAHAVDRQPRHDHRWHRPARPPLAGGRGRGGRGVGRGAVGLGPDRARPRRALRPIRARRRPARGGGPRGLRVRPSRHGGVGWSTRATSNSGRSITTTSPRDSRSSGRPPPAIRSSCTATRWAA